MSTGSFNISYLSDRTDYGAMADVKCFNGHFKDSKRNSLTLKCVDDTWTAQEMNLPGDEEQVMSPTILEELECVENACGIPSVVRNVR